MTQLMRRLRGALGIGVTWAALWVVFGILITLGFRVFRPQDIDPGEGLGRTLPIFGLLGFLSGLGFAAILSVVERRRTLQDLSLGRVALWGLVGGVAIPLLLGANANMGWVTGPMGAFLATASVAAARQRALRGAEPPRQLE